MAHVAFGDDHAELGLSVLPAHRGRGVGSALFERAAAHARNRFVGRLFMHCLRENAPIMRIARRYGMDIVTDIGDADAHLALPPASPASIAGEFVTDRFALYDHALKAHVAAWKRINAVLLEAAPAPEPVGPKRRSPARDGKLHDDLEQRVTLVASDRQRMLRAPDMRPCSPTFVAETDLHG